jgi:hypothetical protein
MADRISEQTVLEKVFDPLSDTLAITNYGFDGSTAQADPPKATNLKITKVGDVTYVAKSAPGTAQGTAKWQCKKIDGSVVGTTLITFADGNADFDNTATDLTALTYS